MLFWIGDWLVNRKNQFSYRLGSFLLKRYYAREDKKENE